MADERLNGSEKLIHEPSGSKSLGLPPAPPEDNLPADLMTALYNIVETPLPHDPRIGTYVATETEIDVVSDDRSVRLRCSWHELATGTFEPHDFSATWQLPVENSTPPYVHIMFDLFLRAFRVLDANHQVKAYPTLEDAKKAAPLIAERLKTRPCRLTLSLDTTGHFLVGFVHPIEKE
jgi:hypothetical protein